LEDFNALAVSLGHGMADVRGCLILSRDGLVLGAHPAESERTTTRAWIRFAAIGDPERGFAQFGHRDMVLRPPGPVCRLRRLRARGAARPGDRPHGAGAARGRGEPVAARGAARDRGRDRGPSIQTEVVPAPRARSAGSLGDRRPGAHRRAVRRSGVRPAPAALDPRVRGGRHACERRPPDRRAATRRVRSVPGTHGRPPAAGVRARARGPKRGGAGGTRARRASRLGARTDRRAEGDADERAMERAGLGLGGSARPAGRARR
jgi:hypothetical protein